MSLVSQHLLTRGVSFLFDRAGATGPTSGLRSETVRRHANRNSSVAVDDIAFKAPGISLELLASWVRWKLAIGIGSLALFFSLLPLAP